MISVIRQAVECVLSLYLIGLAGFIIDRRRWCGPETKLFLARLVTLVALPPYLFVNVLHTFNREELAHLLPGVLVPAVSIVLNYILGLILVRLFKTDRSRRGLVVTGFASSNTIFMGLPVNVALFGETALPYVLLYFFANTTFFWTWGHYLLSRDGEKQPEQAGRLQGLRHVFSPPLIGFGLGLAALLSGFAPPAFILNAASLIGGLTTPLALLFLGLSLGRISGPELKPDRDLALVLLGRFVTSPLSVILLTRLVDMPPLMIKVFLIQSSLPAPANLAILSGFFRSDPKFGSRAVLSGTLMSLLTIPLFMILIQLAHLD